jgi:hypothetical protein
MRRVSSVGASSNGLAARAGGGVEDLVYKHTLREIIAGQVGLCSSVYCCATTVPMRGAAH